MVKILSACFVIFLGVLGGLHFYFSNDNSTEETQLCDYLKNSVEVSGDLGAIPIVDLKEPIVATNSCSEIVANSNSVPLNSNDPVLLSITVFNSRTGDKLSGETPKIISGKLTKDLVDENVYATLLNARLGERIVTYLPNKVDNRIDGELSVIDVLPTYIVSKNDFLAKDFSFKNVNYTVDKETGEKLPLQVSYKNAKPRFGEFEHKPEKSVAYILVKGEGQQLAKDSAPVVQYVARNVSDGKIVETTYDTGIAKKLDFTQTYKSIGTLLADMTVGSRVLLYLSAEDTDGKEPIVMLVDIIALNG